MPAGRGWVVLLVGARGGFVPQRSEMICCAECCTAVCGMICCALPVPVDEMLWWCGWRDMLFALWSGGCPWNDMLCGACGG